MAPSTQFELPQPPTDAVSSLVFSPDSSHRLLVSSWDRHVYLYQLTEGEGDNANLLNKYEHRAPVLDVCFGDASNNDAYTAGMDRQVKKIDLISGEQTVLSKHSEPVRCVVYSSAHNLLISASWDNTLHVHKLSEPGSDPLVIPLPGKPHALSSSPTKLVVAMTARLVHIYDLPTLAAATSPPAPWQTRESSLKFLTRAVACMPNDAGYATSSIEGRVAVEWFEDTPESQARKYAFKCHRQAAPEEEGGGDIVYPVNALAFHPVYGTFASGGGDGTVALWDAEAKRRMRQYQKFPEAVASLGFSGDGKYLAIGVCPGFETGMEDYTGQGRTRVFVRELGETEAKGKGTK
ncbi:mitotic spindle checkpoint protein Bub3 [Podospora pseudoanserina]|uniref:Mitotic spindle checkpoint protein Bub3 n=1 Tax=Podospora pseudoanserina TaxID=2609844 RepID=A0ABR0HTT8_9PEZI|nr:mitotic spindle checkpoint protein Bub3 [Podospora pseudoanserina]